MVANKPWWEQAVVGTGRGGEQTVVESVDGESREPYIFQSSRLWARPSISSDGASPCIFQPKISKIKSIE